MTAQRAILKAQSARRRANVAGSARRTDQSRRAPSLGELQAVHVEFYKERTGEVLDVPEKFLPQGGVRPPCRMVPATRYEALTGRSLVNTPATTAGNQGSTATTSLGYSITSHPISPCTGVQPAQYREVSVRPTTSKRRCVLPMRTRESGKTSLMTAKAKISSMATSWMTGPSLGHPRTTRGRKIGLGGDIG